MELFWIAAAYAAILALCWWAAGHTQRRRWMAEHPSGRPRPEPQPPAEPAPPAKPAPQPDPGRPLDPEVLPDPRQTAQELSRGLEQLARRLADSLGVELQDFDAAAWVPPARPDLRPGGCIDLEEKDPPRG